MELGTSYRTISELVSIVEVILGITLNRSDHDEIGTYYYRCLENETGISFLGIEILPTRYFDEDEGEMYLADESWEPYTFVLQVSDGLTEEVKRIRQAVEGGQILGDEILPPFHLHQRRFGG